MLLGLMLQCPTTVASIPELVEMPLLLYPRNDSRVSTLSCLFLGHLKIPNCKIKMQLVFVLEFGGMLFAHGTMVKSKQNGYTI